MTAPRTTGRTTRSTLVAAVSVLALILAVIAAIWLSSGESGDGAAPSASAAPSTSATQSAATAAPGPGGARAPQRVHDTLALIDAGAWPKAANAPGTRGGGRFGNHEGLLPATGANGRPISYTEWDVNPKKPNRGRDAERIVTGSDGSAWYTLDHYRTFTQIRGPSR